MMKELFWDIAITVALVFAMEFFINAVMSIGCTI